MEAKFILVLCALLACALAGPLTYRENEQTNTDSCARTCDAPSKFRYLAGSTYTYDYEIQTETSMTGASEQKAVVIITGQADIEVIDQCDLVLKMKNVQVQESSPDSAIAPSDEEGQLRRMLESRPLRFAFQDGVVSEVCPDRDELPQALNIKRGLLSALQNSMDKLEGNQTKKDTDVTGTCGTTYEARSHGYWGHKTIKRTKDIDSCTDRHSYLGSLQSIKYQLPEEMQAAPLMKSEHECEQEVKSNIIQSSQCREKHIFRPFSSDSNGAATTVNQKLTLRGTQPRIDSRKDWIHSRADLTFDHGFDMKDSSEARARALAVLSTLCDVTSNGIKPEVPRIFSHLVEAVKKMSRDDISEVYGQLQRGMICTNNAQRTKKFFLDALPMASSNDAVSVMKDLMVRGDVTGVEVDLWLTSLAFIPQPSEDMLDSVKELLKTDSLRIQAMLPVSAMLNNFCSKMASCDIRAVRDIMQAFDDAIGYRCTINDGNINTVLTTLRAIGNAGQSRGADIVRRCLNDRLPIEVRVAAAQAYRRMPCDADKSQLQTILEDKAEDTEMRIAAYLQVMTCPTSDLLTQIQVILEAEDEDSQVGSFIYSHLDNLKETSSPWKQAIKQLVRNVQLKKLFELNPLKASRNYEKSAFLKALKLGGQAESNVIFSSRSPLPRSMTANLTVEVLGHSLNLLEVGARLEGLEYLIENMQNNLFGDGKEKSPPKTKIDELKGSGFARVFGNELAFGRFQGLSSMTSGNTFNILDFLIKLSKDHDYSFTQSMQLLDVSMTVPTAGGMPLILSVNGTAVVDLQASGKMDLRKVSSSPRSIFIDGQIKPSGAVSVESVMSVDALVTRTGLRMSSSLHSSMSLKGRVELDKGRVLSVEIDMPDDKMEIIDVRTKFFIVHNDQEKEQDMITDNRKQIKVCSGAMGAKISGLEVCGEVQFPNASMLPQGPYFPLTGPAAICVVLHKRDSHTGYKLLAKRAENKRSSIAQLVFDTPGSSVVRAVSFDMDINYAQNQVDLTFASPWWKTAVKGAYMNEDQLKSVSGEIVLNDDQKYALTSELKIDQQDSAQVLTPLLKVTVLGQDVFGLTGNVRLDSKGKEFATDLTLDGVTSMSVQFQSSLTNTKSDLRLAGAVNYGDKSYKAEGGVKYNIREGKSARFNPLVLVSTPSSEVLKFEGDIDFRHGKMLRSELTLTAPDLLATPIKAKCDLAKKETKNNNRYSVDVQYKSRPFYGRVNGNVKLGDISSSKMTLEYNVRRMASDKITLNGKIRNRSSPVLTKYSIVNANLDFKNNPDYNVKVTKIDFEHKNSHTSGNLELAVGQNPKAKDSQIVLSTTINRKVKDITDVDVDYKGKALIPMIGLDTNIVGSHTHNPDGLASRMTLDYGKDKTVKAEVNLKNKGDDDKLKMSGDGSLSFPGYSYDLSTALKQGGKQYLHTIQMKSQDGQLLDVTSSYKPGKDDTHEVSSDIQIGEYKPIKVSGTAGLEMDNLQLQGELLHGKDSYSLNALSKLTKGPRGKWTLELVKPSRKVAISVMGGLQDNSAEFDLDLAWDKDRDESAKITASMSGSSKSSRDVRSTVAKADILTPFSILSKLSAGLSVDSDLQRYGLDGKFSLNDDSFTSKLEARKPLSADNIQVTYSAETPFKGLKRVEASIDHTIKPRSLRTVLSASRGRQQTTISILGNDNSQGRVTEMSADVTFKSDEYDEVRDVAMSVAHKSDGRKYESRVSYIKDGQKYGASVDMTHYRQGWTMQNVGQVKVTLPDKDIVTDWQHRSSDSDIKSILNSDFGSGKLLKVELTGDKKVTSGSTSVNGALAIRSPWQLPKDLSVTVQHDHSNGRLQHSSSINVNGRKSISADINYQLANGDLSGDVALTLPYMEDKSGKVKVLYSRYPYSGNVELKTSPSSLYSGDVSFVKRGYIDMEGSARISTPHAQLPSLVVSGSLKQEGQDLIYKGILDLGVRNSYDAEIRIRPQDLTLARVKINAPLRQMSSLDTGYLISGDLDDLELTGDLSMEPLVGKYSGLARYRYDDDGISGKVRVDTPIKALRYAQVTFNSQPDGAGRKSSVEAQYYPRETYTLTSFYTTSLPLILTVQAQTPIRGYDSFGLSFKHQHDDRAINTHGELQYLPGKTLEGTLNVNMQPKLDAYFVVKTPFRGYEESKVSVRHDGDLSDFTTHGEMEMMQQKATADVSFKTGYSSSGRIALALGQGIPSMEAAFSKRGYMDNIKGSAYVSYGDKKVEGKLNHKLIDGNMQSLASLKTPFSEDSEVKVDLTKQGSSYQHEISAKYGDQYKVESSSSLAIALPDIAFASQLKYKLASPQKVISVSMNKKGDYNDMDLSAAFTSPFTKDAAVAVKNQNRLPYSIVASLNANYGDDMKISSENNYYNSRDISAGSVNKAEVFGQKHEFVANMAKKGDIRDMDLSADASYNGQKIGVVGQVKKADGVEGRLEIKTPFSDYDSMAMDFAHKPKSPGFSQKGSVTYKRGKTISYSVDLTASGIWVFDMDAQLTTPFSYMEQTSVKISHKTDDVSKRCTGSGEIQNSFLGSKKLSYRREGDLSHFTLDATLDNNGQRMTSHSERIPLSHGYRHSVDFTIPSGSKYSSSVETEMSQDGIRGKLQSGITQQYEVVLEADGSIVGDIAQINMKASSQKSGKTSSAILSVKKNGPLNDMTVEVKGGIDAKQGSATMMFKKLSGEIAGNIKVKTPFDSFTDVGACFEHSGDLDRFNSQAGLKYMDDKEMTAKASFYRYQTARIEANAELTTPFPALSKAKAEYRHSATSEEFSCDASLFYNDENTNKWDMDIRGKRSPKVEGSIKLRTPISQWSRLQAEGSFDSMAGTKALTSSLDLASFGRYSLDAALDSHSIPASFTTQLTTPHEILPRLQITAAHQGSMKDFSSSFSLTTPKLDTIKGDASLRYGSIFDITGAASFTTGFSGLEELKAEVKNTDVGASKSGHVMARWAPGQQVSVDGTYSMKDYYSNQMVQADIALATPFKPIRAAAAHVEYEQSDSQYKPKVTMSLNGRPMLDIEGEMVTKSNPSVSLTSRKPWPAQVTAALTKGVDSKEGEIFVNWNRDKSDQNLRFKVKAKDSKDDQDIDKDYVLTVIHPSRTMSTSMKLTKSPSKITSEGYFSWDDATNSKVFYNLDFNDNSQYSRKVYDGSVKLGLPSRSVQATGSYSNNRAVTYATDAAISWDADRDSSKQVGFNAKLTNGQTTKADLTFRLPAIGKEVHIDHEMSLNQGQTVWDGKTALSYSKDARKTLTVASSLKDISAYAAGQNYSLYVAITHPITNTDISVTSHLGSAGGRYSAALDTVYLTSRRQRKNMALRGEIDRIRQQIDLQLDSPLKKVALKGEVESSEPYVLKLTNTYDDSKVIVSKLAIDSDNIIISTNYDLDQPDRQLILKAGYLNSTYLKAELFTQQQDGAKISSDTLMALRLVDPSLLKASIAWRPDMMQEMQDYASTKTLSYASSIRQTLHDATYASGQEVSDKYTAIAKELTDELSPIIDLVQNELDRIGAQVDLAYRNLYQMYLSNGYYVKDLGDGVRDIILAMRKYNDAYKAGYADIIGKMRQQLEQIKSYNIRAQYEAALSQIADIIAVGLARNADWLNQAVIILNNQLDSVQSQVSNRWADVKNNARIQQAGQRVQLLGHDFKWLMGHMQNQVQQFSIPQQYTNAIYGARDVVSSGLSDVMDSPQIKKAQEVANEIYQQGAWAYKYWQVEDNARKGISKLGEIITELVKAEFQELTDKYDALRKSKVTVYDPEKGVIEIDIYLPVPLKSLKEFPDITTYVDSASDAINQYVPDKEAVVNMYNKYSPWLQYNKTSPNVDIPIGVMSDLQNFQPSVSRRGGGYNPRYRVRGV